MGKFSEYFNSTTIRGRANVAKATYASIATLYILNRIRKGRKKTDSPPPAEGQEEAQKDEPQIQQEAKQEAVNGDTHMEGNGKCQCSRCQCKTPSVKAEDKTIASEDKPNDNVPEAESESSDNGNGERQNGSTVMPSDLPEKSKDETAVGEAIIKSAKGKCESGCGPEFVSTTQKIEQKYLKLYDEDINFWWE